VSQESSLVVWVDDTDEASDSEEKEDQNGHEHVHSRSSGS